MIANEQQSFDIPRPDWLPETEFPFQSRIVRLGGHRIHYIDEGSGPTLLFVHAGPAWSFIFRDLITRLRDRFRCIALDFPGAGLSHPGAGYRASIESAAAVFEAFVVALDLRTVTLVVHDLGGPVALGVASNMLDRFVAIAVADSFGWSLSEENPKIARVLRLVGGRTLSFLNNVTNYMARVTATPYGAGRRLTAKGRRAFLGPYRDRSVRRNAAAMLLDAARATEYLRGLDLALRTTLGSLPLLLVFGKNSPTFKEGFPERWKERFPAARLVVVEGGHHFPMADAPDVVADAICGWWGQAVSGDRKNVPPVQGIVR